MKKILLLISMIALLLLSACEDSMNSYNDKEEICYFEAIDSDCNKVIECMEFCNNLSIVSWRTECHVRYNNLILTKC